MASKKKKRKNTNSSNLSEHILINNDIFWHVSGIDSLTPLGPCVVCVQKLFDNDIVYENIT